MRGNGEGIMTKKPVLTFGMTIKNAFDEEAVVTKHFANSVNKPVGGLWLSPIAEGKSEWVRFCEKEMPDWIRNSYHYEVELTFDGIRIFTAPPTKDEMQALLSDNECNGFFVIGVHTGRDVQSLWVKDSRCFKKITEKGRQLSEIA